MNLLIKFLFLTFNFQAQANIGGSDLQNFNPTTNGLGFITVHSSQTLEPGEFNVGSFVNYTTNSLAYSTLSFAPNNQTFTEPNDKLLYSNIHLGVGLMQGWDIGFSAGFINSQNIEQSNFLFAYGDTGVNDLRLNTKIQLYRSQSFNLATLLTMDLDQIKNNPFVGDNAGPTFNFEFAADIKLHNDFLWAVNFGYRLRQQGTAIPNTGVIPISDQWLYSTALSYSTDDDGSALIAELYGSYPLEQTTTPTDRELSNLELLVGYKWSGLKNLDLHAGFGTEAYQGLGSPDIRVYAGVNWKVNFLNSGSNSKPAPLQNTENSNDSDSDGVPNPIDQCPDTQEKSRVDERGCQFSSSSNKGRRSVDEDQDGVRDVDDRCPNTPLSATVNAYGCPVKNYN